MPCVAGRGRRMQKQFGSGRGIITTEFRIEVAVSTNVDTGLERLAEPVHSGISNMTGVLPGNDHAVSSDPARCIFW